MDTIDNIVFQPKQIPAKLKTFISKIADNIF